MTERATARLVELWRAKVAEGVHVRIVTKPPGDAMSQVCHIHLWAHNICFQMSITEKIVAY